jgi:16S rRNA (cytosine967-C5)-methyltransferase
MSLAESSFTETTSPAPHRAALGHEMATAAYAIVLMAPQLLAAPVRNNKNAEPPVSLRLQEALRQAHVWAELPSQSFPATQELTYSAVRQLGLTGRLVGLLVQKPPGTYTLHFLQVALTQLISNIRSPAVVVDQAVSMAKEVPELEGQGGFINGLLRKFLRERQSLLAQARVHPEAAHNFPQWWQDRLIKGWGVELAHEIMASAQSAPPFTLRINQLWGTAEAYAEADKNAQQAFKSQTDTTVEFATTGATDQSAEAQDSPNTVVAPEGSTTLTQARTFGAIADSAAVILPPVPVDRLEGFAQGWVSVQDLAAQLAAQLLDVQPQHHVLDACAAPGGKTTHLLEYQPSRLVAADVEPARLAKIRENLQRYQSFGGMNVELLRADLKKFGPSNRAQFDRILLDAPCSASGIVRRHPDIRWVRKRGDLATLVAEQKALLASLWLSLKPGGKLLYATCSVFPEENDDVVRAFVDKTTDAHWISLSAPLEGLRLAPGRSNSLRLLPSDGVRSGLSQTQDENAQSQTSEHPTHEHDGFYLALLEKRI